MSVDRSAERSILVQRQVRARLIVIAKIRGQNPLQMSRTEDEDVIQAVAPQEGLDNLLRQPFRRRMPVTANHKS